MKQNTDNLTYYKLRVFFCVMIIILHSGTLFAEILPYTIKNGWFPRNIIEPNETRLVVEGLPSRFLIKLKERYHIEYASLFDKGKYISYSFGERIAKGKYLDDRTANGYIIANGLEGGFETKLVILKPQYDKSGHLIYLDSNTIAGDKISPSDNPIIEVIPIPEYDNYIKYEEIISSSTTGLINLNRTDNPIHIKTNDGHVFCICTYSLIDNDGIKRFKGYLLSISEGNGLQNQVVKRLDFESMGLHPSNTPQIAFDESLQRLFILFDNQLILSDDYGNSFSFGQDIQINTQDH